MTSSALLNMEGEDMPQYAILSHTWGSDDQELSFLELMKTIGVHSPTSSENRRFDQVIPVGADFELQDHRIATQAMKSKAGWRKIQFCGDEAARDGLDYFWVDSCCIRNVAQKTMPYESGGCCRRNRWSLKF
jgi:hypothetical protein